MLCAFVPFFLFKQLKVLTVALYHEIVSEVKLLIFLDCSGRRRLQEKQAEDLNNRVIAQLFATLA
jgi:hypothetical protein